MKNIFPFYYDNEYMKNSLCNVFGKAIIDSSRFNIELFSAFAEAYSTYYSVILEYNKSWKDLPELEKLLKKRFHKIFDKKFRDK
jgi:hypothetical protein